MYLIKVIEERNKEILDLLSSEYYLQGKKYVKFKKMLKHGKFLTIIKKIIYQKKYKKNMPSTIDNDESNLTCNEEFINNSKIKIAVYTCVTGKYDYNQKIMFKESCCDYFYYTDDDKQKDDNPYWTIKKIDKKIIQKYKNNIDINRYLKMHPHLLFGDRYDYSIYIDGNIEIESILSDLIDRVQEKGIAFHNHNSRECIFDEGKMCINSGKGNKEKISETLNKYREEGMPENYGLLECNVIVTNLKNNYSKKILSEWWDEFYKSQCYRDQLILPYIIWRNGDTIQDYGTLGHNVYRNAKFKIINHEKK